MKLSKVWVFTDKKLLKTRERGTSKNNMLMVTRVRKLYNKILQMDENLIISITSAENNQIEKLVHEFKDNYTLGGSELVKVFGSWWFSHSLFLYIFFFIVNTD